MPRVIFFEFPADNPDRAVSFYKSVFDWQMNKWGMENYWLVTTGQPPEPGIDGAIKPREGQPGVVNTVGVPDLDAYVKKVVAAGGSVVAPRMAVQSMGYLAYCKDTEGNVFGMMQIDENAK
jgi:uncharacterized protein